MIHIIDTPGFDDSHKDNVNVLEEIVRFLCTFYEQDCLQIVGLIYFQRISDVRMSGSSLKSLRIFEKLCGIQAFPNVMIVTTFWSVLQDEQMKIGEDREITLQTEDTFFGRLVKEEAKMRRFGDTQESAHDIVEDLLKRQKWVVLQIQQEIVDEGKSLAETEVGQYLEWDLLAMREKYERALEELGKDYEEAIAGDQDDDLLTTISDEIKAAEEHIRQSRIAQKNLSVTYEDMAQKTRDWLTGGLQGGNLGDGSIDEKSMRVAELEEQLGRMEIDHIRQLNIVRRDNEAQRTDAYMKGYEESKKKLQEKIKRERSNKEWRRTRPNPIFQILSSVFKPVELFPGTTPRRSESFPIDTRRRNSARDLHSSQKRGEYWRNSFRLFSSRPKSSKGPLLASSQDEMSRSQDYGAVHTKHTYHRDNEEDREDEEDQEDVYYPQSHSYRAVEIYPEGTNVASRGEVMFNGPRRTPTLVEPRVISAKLTRSYDSGSA